MNKRVMAAALCFVMLAATACGGRKKEESSDKEQQNAAAAATVEEKAAVEKYTPAVHEEGKYYVGVIQQADHGALSLAAEGFRDHLSELLGDEVVLDEKVSDGTDEKTDEIIDHFIQDKDDLILAAGSGALRQAAAQTKDIPIVGAAVTDFIIAGGVSSNGEPGGNVTGISDLPPMVSQRDLLLQLNSDGEQIGILFCSEEVNSEFQCRLMEKYLSDADTPWKEYTFTGAADMEEKVKAACEENGVIYLPCDNVLAVNMDVVSKYAVEYGTKVFTSDGDMCKKGGLVSYGVDYYAIGTEAANMAYDILVYGGEDGEVDEEDEDRGNTAKMAIDRLSDTASAWYNPVMAEAVGWEPSGTYEELDVERPDQEKTAEDSAAETTAAKESDS